RAPSPRGAGGWAGGDGLVVAGSRGGRDRAGWPCRGLRGAAGGVSRGRPGAAGPLSRSTERGENHPGARPVLMLYLGSAAWMLFMAALSDWPRIRDHPLTFGM